MRLSVVVVLFVQHCSTIRQNCYTVPSHIQRMIHCSHETVCFEHCNRLYKSACIFSFVNPSARLALERINLILDISLAWYAWRAACISSIIRFPLQRYPFEIMSNSDFGSVRRCIGTERLSECSISDLNAYPSSNNSEMLWHLLTRRIVSLFLICNS